MCGTAGGVAVAVVKQLVASTRRRASHSGRTIWWRKLKATVPQWGFAVSPLVVDGKVIVFAPGKDADGLMAFDAATGELKWKIAGGGDTYSSPQFVELGGVRQMLMQDNGHCGR